MDSLKDAIYHEEIEPILEAINDFSLYQKIELEEMEKDALIYLSNENMEFIDHLKKHTVCNELKKLADVLPIIKVHKQKID